MGQNMTMMKWLFFLIVFLLPAGSTVVFTVIDSNENPIEGAEIYFCARKAVTDAEGKATFENIPDLSDTEYSGCTLEIRKEGYLPVTDAFAVTEDMILTYILYSDIMATISGTVYFDSSDNPAPFIAVRIYGAVTDEPLASILTDENGRFSFEISVDRPIYAVVSDYEDQKFFLSTDKEQVLVVNTKGIISDVEISIRDTKGRPLEDVLSTLESDLVTYKGTTDAKGNVVFQTVTRGKYVLTLEKERYSTVTQEVSVAPSEKDGVYHLDFILELATSTVVINVFSAANRLPVSATVVVTAEGEEVTRILVEGTESITLEPGTYTLDISTSGFEPVKRQVLLLEGQTKNLDFELEASQRTVRAKSETVPLGILLLGAGGILFFILLYIWKR